MPERPEISVEAVDSVIDELSSKIHQRLRENGYHTLASTHEILGILEEERIELIDAVKGNIFSDVEHELYDIAVGALFGIACLQAGELDW